MTRRTARSTRQRWTVRASADGRRRWGGAVDVRVVSHGTTFATTAVVVTVLSVASSTICDAIVSLSAWLRRMVRALRSGRAANDSSNSGEGNYTMLAPWPWAY